MMTRHNYSPCSCSPVDGRDDLAPRPETTCLCLVCLRGGPPFLKPRASSSPQDSSREYNHRAAASPHLVRTTHRGLRASQATNLQERVLQLEIRHLRLANALCRFVELA